MSGKRAIVPAAILTFIAALLVGQGAAAADRYDTAVNHPGRSAADIERDSKDQPARVLRLTGIGPGMHVVDVLGGSGYYSELLSYLVGPKGEVLLVNNAGFDSYDPSWNKRLAGDRLRHAAGKRDFRCGAPHQGLSRLVLERTYRRAAQDRCEEHP
jgi:predicted methyltransferase